MTKKQKVLERLKAGDALTSMKAFDLFRETRLAATIHDLKADGHNITTTLLPTNDGKSKYAVYQLTRSNA